MLTGTAEVIKNGGLVPQTGTAPGRSQTSPRKRGLKLGLFIFLLTFLLVPLVAIISKSLDITPVFVAITAIIFPMGGLLRIMYAALFESGEPDGSTTLEQFPTPLSAPTAHGALPPTRSIPASDYVSPAGKWRETSDLKVPGSVTDDTTKLLVKDEDPQQDRM